MAQNRKTKKNKSNAKSWKSMFTFFRDMDPELKSILVKCAGGLVLLIALFTFVSMFSYVFTWSVDMDLLMNAERLSRDVDVSNMGGKLGYLWSHFLISDMLGLASFVFVFLMAALAYRLFFWQRHIGLMRLTFLSVSGAFVLSMALSLFGSVRVFDGGLGGDAGRAVTDSLENLLGPVLPWLIVVALAVVWMLFASGRFARWFALSGDRNRVEEPVADAAVPVEEEEAEDDDTEEEIQSEDEEPESEEEEVPDEDDVLDEELEEEELEADVEPVVSNDQVAPADPADDMEVIRGEVVVPVVEDLPRIDNRDELSRYDFPSLDLLHDYTGMTIRSPRVIASVWSWVT